MHHSPRVTIERRNGNLHTTINGEFTPETAARLAESMRASYTGQGNIFIHTKMITGVAPGSRSFLTELLRSSALPQERIYFTGSRGKEIAPDGSRVIVHAHNHEAGGCGRCRNCSCREKQAA